MTSGPYGVFIANIFRFFFVLDLFFANSLLLRSISYIFSFLSYPVIIKFNFLLRNLNPEDGIRQNECMGPYIATKFNLKN